MFQQLCNVCVLLQVKRKGVVNEGARDNGATKGVATLKDGAVTIGGTTHSTIGCDARNYGVSSPKGKRTSTTRKRQHNGSYLSSLVFLPSFFLGKTKNYNMYLSVCKLLEMIFGYELTMENWLAIC